MLTIENLTNVHAHLRGGLQSYKGDIDSETQAAIAGGFTTVLAMPNTNPPIVDEESLEVKILEAESQANCLVGLYAGATDTNSRNIYQISEQVCALKIYMNNTTGDMKIVDMNALENHFKNWNGQGPICVHAEEEFGSLSLALRLAEENNQRLHVCHVSSKQEIDLIERAKEEGQRVTCEVAPHHLVFTSDDLKYLKGYGFVKPEFKTKDDTHALLSAIKRGVVDVIADDHAPHTKEEKESGNPPSGIPGLETTLPIMLSLAESQNIPLEKLFQMLTVNPKRIFSLPKNPQTYTMIDMNNKYYLDERDLKTKCGYSPYKDQLLTGRVSEVCIRGQVVFRDGEHLGYAKRTGNDSLVIKKYGN